MTLKSSSRFIGYPSVDTPDSGCCIRQKYETSLDERIHKHNYLQPKPRPFDPIYRSKTGALLPYRKGEKAMCVTPLKRVAEGYRIK